VEYQPHLLHLLWAFAAGLLAANLGGLTRWMDRANGG
jgi:hypothetical protein